MPQEGDKCPHCENGTLELAKGFEPYNVDNLQCSKCDSTYGIEENKMTKRFKYKRKR